MEDLVIIDKLKEVHIQRATANSRDNDGWRG